MTTLMRRIGYIPKRDIRLKIHELDQDYTWAEMTGCLTGNCLTDKDKEKIHIREANIKLLKDILQDE